jgi:hypothetical protein
MAGRVARVADVANFKDENRKQANNDIFQQNRLSLWEDD